MSHARAPQARPVPTLLLERHRRGELEPELAQRIDAALRDDPALRARLEALDHDDQVILKQHPPAAFAQALRPRLTAEPRPSPRGWLGGGAALMAAAAAALLFIPSDPSEYIGGSTTAPALEETVAKGGAGPQLVLFRKAADAAERLSDGSEAAEGDVLGIAYQAASAAHGVIFSIDGRGTITLHHPSPPEASSALAPGGVVNLDQAYQLDDAPGFERFVLVTGERPIDLQQVLAAAATLSPGAAAAAPLPLPAGLRQASLTLKKAR